MLNILQIGTGPWGQNYLKTLQNFPVKTTIANRNNWQDLIIKNKPQGVIISTPPQTHIPLALFALSNNIPVLLEKPLALTLPEAQQLIPYSHLPLLINHTVLFTQAFERVHKFCKDHEISNISVDLYNDGPIRDYSSWLDYGPHALAIIFSLFINHNPQSIEVYPAKNENDEKYLYHFCLRFEKKLGYGQVGNGGKEKVRKWEIESDGMWIEYDDLKRPDNQIPPLQRSIEVFLGAIEGKEDWRLGLDLGLKVMKWLEEGERKIRGE